VANFLLLIRGDSDTYTAMTPNQLEDVMHTYFAWTDKLRTAGQLLASEHLHPGGSTVRARDGQPVMDGPFAETKEGIGGFYVITAPDAAAAAEIAKGCPALLYGDFMDIRAAVDYSA